MKVPPKIEILSYVLLMCVSKQVSMHVCAAFDLFICVARSDQHSSKFLHAVMDLPP